MHSLLDDAFALVSPSSQGSAGLSGVSPALPSPSPQARPPGRQWGSYPAAPSHSPFSAVSVLSCSWGPFPSVTTPSQYSCSFSLSAEIRGAGNVSHISPGPAAEVSTLQPRSRSESLTQTVLMLFVLSRQGLNSGGYVSTGDQLQESVYSNRGQYEDPPSSSRPRPVGGSTGTLILMYWLHAFPIFSNHHCVILYCIFCCH